MLRLALIAGLLAISQNVAAKYVEARTIHTSAACEGFGFFSPTEEGVPQGTPLLQNESYQLNLPNCEIDNDAPGIWANFSACPDVCADGHLKFSSAFGNITIDETALHTTCVTTAPVFIGQGNVLNFELIQGKSYFNFVMVLWTQKYTDPTTTTVSTTPAIPTRPTIPSAPSDSKLDLVIVLDEVYNLNTSLKAINDIVTSFIDLVNPVTVADPLTGIRINPIFVGPMLFSHANWRISEAAFLNMLDAFLGSFDLYSAHTVGPTDYTPVSAFLDNSFGASNKNIRDHTTRALLIFTSNDSSKTRWAEDFITKAQQYDVHTVVVPVDSDVTNIKEQLSKYPDVSTKPLFYEPIDSTSYNATEVAEDLFQNYLLNGNKLCNVKCVASGNDFKFPNVPTAFKGNHYCANTKGFRCSLKEIFAKTISSGNFAANVFAATTAKPVAATSAKPTGCSLDKEVTVYLTEYDINTGFDTLNFYEVTEIKSFTGFEVKNSEFKANLSDAYFVFNSAPSSVYGGFELSISC
uniref:VWFA domain-containing protein n=1 Tax=Steinernema glaseri TaxID=37863 RepID=A0A1I7YEM8_9BILA